MSDPAGLLTDLQERLINQSEHPVHPPIRYLSGDSRTLEALVQIGSQRFCLPIEGIDKMRKQREGKIKREKEDRFRYRSEPEMWGKIDLAMAKKRLEHPGVQLELLVMGGVRGSKTDLTHSRALIHFFYTQSAWCWGLHETQSTSKTIQQRRIMEFFPPEMNPDSGKYRKDKHTRMSYSDGSGFTGDMFTLKWTCKDEDENEFDGGGLFDFKFYRSEDSTLQGAELTCAVSDELIPLPMCDTVRERLLSRSADTRHPKFLARIRRAVEIMEAGKPLPGPLLAAIYHGVHLIGFTPKEGYSPTVADFLDSAVTIEDSDTRIIRSDILGLDEEFVAKWGDKELLPGKRVPRFKQPKKATRLVAYLHTSDNAHKGNWPAQVQQCQHAPEGYIRTIAYGDVSKGWSVRFAKYSDKVHLVTKDWIKQHVKEGTWYQVIDPHGERMWFMIWALVCPNGNIYIVRESPLTGDMVPDVGDPGDWAVSSINGMRNGDAGPAQEGKGWGTDRYVAEMLRVEEEISAWWGSPIQVVERIVDSRGGQNPTLHSGGTSTTFDDLCERDDISGFTLAQGSRLSDGDQKINDRLDYDITTGKAPKLFASDECKAIIFMFQNYGNPLKPKDEACKEPRDCIAYLTLAEPEHIPAKFMDSYTSGAY